MRSRSLLVAGLATALPIVGSLAFAPAAFATKGDHGPKGDNGDIKIHDAATDEERKENNPRVCEFYLDAFNFDGGQDANWKIKVWPPSEPKGKVAQRKVAQQGVIQLDDEGHGRTEDIKLPDGHYKLVWNFEGERGRAKHKVFWVECEEEPSKPPSERPSEEPSENPSQGSSEELSQEPSEEPSQELTSQGVSDDASEVPAPDSSTSTRTDSQLANTGAGAPIVPLAVGAAVLIGAGVLVARRQGTARGE